ncbi:YfhD family protein [Paenibacillus sp. 79R4]|nr:YfhD family protein [Paenibacillus sp. 79R4]
MRIHEKEGLDLNHSQSGHNHRKSPASAGAEGHYEDVEFSEEQADQEDWEALERSERADARMQHRKKLNP